jgi:predicted GNAT family acetyltransferase
MADYRCIRHTSPREFMDRAQSWLVLNEAENNLILSVANQLLQTPKDEAYFATVERDGEVVGCAFRTPPYKLAVTRMPPDAVDAFVDSIVQEFDHTPAVLGPAETARPVAVGIAQRQGGTVSEGMAQRIYELREVIAPEKWPPGKMRLAQPADSEIIAEWLEGFTSETAHGPGDVRSYTAAHIANKTVFFWDDDGPKTTALWAGVTPNGVRVGFVYTPPQFRGHGYASAVTAAASQRALDNGAQFCCLFTDLSNPTSNAIYQKIGYSPVCDVIDYIIE